MKLNRPCTVRAEENVTLRDLALHLLDVTENAVRAKADIIRISIHLDKNAERLTLCVEDNGPGLSVSPEHALNPFYTTKKGKRTGLGLSLFQAAAWQSQGDLTLSESEFGGMKVEASFLYNHVDRAPLGDIAGTIKALTISNPEIVWICHIEGPGGIRTLVLQDFILENPEASLFTVVDIYADRLRLALQEACINSG